MDNMNLHYHCSEDNCDFAISLPGLPRSKDGKFRPPTYICPNSEHDEDIALLLEISDV